MYLLLRTIEINVWLEAGENTRYLDDVERQSTRKKVGDEICVYTESLH